MDELKPEILPITEQKEWVTPELVVEDIVEATRSGTGKQPVFGGENKVTAFYHS